MNRAWGVCTALVLLFSSTFEGVRAADGLPDAAKIRENVRVASGALPSAFRETTETTTSSGSTTIERQFRRGDDIRIISDTGPFHRERGVFHGDVWRMNDNGQVVMDRPDPGRATPETVTTTVAAIRAPVNGYLIATLNARGFGQKEYVDATTWQYVRREQVGASGSVVSTYEDIRPDHGRTFAHRVRTQNTVARTTSEMRIVEYAPGEVDERDVAMPKPRRQLVQFPAGATSVELPARFGTSHVYVRVTIGGRGLDFVLDTGASGITIDSSVARELGLPEFNKHSAVTAGRYETARTIVPEMRVGQLVMRDVAVQEIPQGWQTAKDVKEVGLLGFDFLAELGVTIDYEHERVVVVPGVQYTAPADPHAIPIDVRIGSGQPRATVALNGAVGERWILDTGGAGTFMIFDYFARRHPEAVRDAGGGGIQRRRLLYGVGGPIPADPYQIASLRIGNVNFADWVGFRVAPGTAYAQNDDGIIGSEFLKLFTVGLDYANERVYLVPNSAGRAAMGLKG